MLIGRTIALRALIPNDYGELYALATSDAITTWRTLARTIAPEAFAAFLWDGVYTQRVVVPVEQPERCLGLVSLHGEDAANQIAYLSVLVHPEAPSPAGGEAVALFLRHVFETTPLRKVYAETTELSLPQLGRAWSLPGVREEGRLVGHLRRGGRDLDLLVLAVHREAFLADLARVEAFLDPDRTLRLVTGPGPVPARAATATLHRSLNLQDFAADLAEAFPHLDGPLGPPDEVVGGIRLVDDLEIDSLMLVEIAAWAEQHYRTTIDDHALARLVTLQDALAAVAPDG